MLNNYEASSAILLTVLPGLTNLCYATSLTRSLAPCGSILQHCLSGQLLCCWLKRAAPTHGPMSWVSCISPGVTSFLTFKCQCGHTSLLHECPLSLITELQHTYPCMGHTTAHSAGTLDIPETAGGFWVNFIISNSIDFATLFLTSF